MLVPGAAAAATAHVGQTVMGTILEVTVVAEDEDLARSLANRSIEIARHWDDVLTTWRSDGELAQMNRQAGGGPIAISKDLRAALDTMLALVRATNGAFDPAVGAIVSALRSGSPTAAAQPLPMTSAVKLDGDRAMLAAGAQLDAGGIGKGIALDAIAAELQARGAKAWFLNFGGSSQLAHGSPHDQGGWMVLVAGERAGVVHGTIELRDASLSTSRAVRADDPAGTIVDPRTGAPVPPPRLATVLARDAATAEAWSKALIIFGRDGLSFARAAGVEAVYEDAAGVTITAEFPLEHGAAAPAPSRLQRTR